ncbi:hypothetical protein CPB83DRAFT_781747 [Crepidotus variabilis]|uniref:PX domain-containing protein n=1 Tax=Crepidotus variabilis TaxID=179855 RepID=A0A9P6JVW6_9AGAR|nr:hypothetical protein CPB83DRAFT_781747 [Crepidotus variabilis]
MPASTNDVPNLLLLRSMAFTTDPPATKPKDEEKSKTELTPLRAHYLKKSLIQLQFTRELDLITTQGPPNVSTLSYLGQPFTPPPKDAPVLDVPFLKYIFRQFFLTFPFMAAAPKDFYSQKLQPFVGALLARNISSSSILDDGDTEQATRLKLLAKLERNLSLFVGSATKLVEPEDVVRLTQADLDRLEALSAKRQKRPAKIKDFFEVNIVGVRTVVEKGRVRSRAHEEFIIRTRRTNFPDTYVSRRYGDFKTLYQELVKAHPEESIRPPPPKDRTYVNAPVTSPTSSRPSPNPVSPTRQFTSDSYADEEQGQNINYWPQSPPPAPVNSRLAREKNRLTLRSYLHSIMSTSSLASSPVIKSFLLSGPTTLTQGELEDAQRREDADRVRDEGRKKFAKEIAGRVDGLRDAIKSVKGDLMGQDGLTHVFATVKVTPNIHDLPENYQPVVEWARISLASTIFHMFIASDDASETYAGLKRIHGLMPYFMLKAALKIANPMAMIRTVMDLFLATPFGGKSLLQRMFTSSLAEEVKMLQDEINAVQEKVDDQVMCAKVQQFVNAPRDIQNMFKADAESEQMDIITVVLRSSEQPILSRDQMHRLARAHRAHSEYLKHKDSLEDSDSDEGPPNEDAWLIEDLRVLAHLYARLKDREDLINLIFEGFTADLLKDIITIFYAPLAQVYRAANIADSFSDLQNFINDLIRTVESVEELSQEDTHGTVQAFINLIQRHEQAFYSFVHKVHSKGEGLFASLMHWIELFLTVIREGLGEKVSLEYLLPHTGKEREDILLEVDKVALYHYKLKVLYEDKLRRRFGRAQGAQSEADAEDDATQALVNGVVSEFNFGDLVSGDALDMAAEDTDEEEDEESSSDEYTTSDYETGSSDESESTRESLDATPKPPPKVPAYPLSPSRPKHQPHDPTSSVNRPHQVKRSSTMNVPSPSSSRTQLPQQPQQPVRKRSLSLSRVKSLMSLNGSSSAARRSYDSLPPVPSLSAASKNHNAALSKPLPESPRSPHPPASPTRNGVKHANKPLLSQKVESSKATKKKVAAPVQPPDLQHIPLLLPVFLEMIRPSLTIQKIHQ